MSAVWLRFRTEFRTRWPGALVLVLVVGFTGGAVLTALAGARRTASSFDRFHDSARSPDVLVTYPTDLDARVRAAISHTPGVEAAAPYQVMAAFPAKVELYTQVAADIDGGLHRDFERGKLLDGRFERRGAADEIAVSEVPSRRLGIGVGDTLELRTYTPEQFDTALNEGGSDLQGPPLRLRVVGVYRSPWDLGAVGDDTVPLLLSRAVLREYRDRIGIPSFRALAVRLTNDESGAPAFFRKFQRAVDDRRVSLEPATLTGVGDSLDVLTLGLLLFAVVVGVAGLVAIGQTLGRRATLAASDQPTLRALGMTAGQRFGVLAGDTIPVAVVGAIVAVALAVVASPIMPIGVGRRAEPDPGFDVDPLALGAGFVGIVLAVAALGMLAAWRAERVAVRVGGPAAASRPSVIARSLGRRGVRPTEVVGVRFALESGRGRTAVPVRSVLVAATAGLAGVVAILVLGASLDRLVTSPQAWGWTFDTHSSVSARQLARDPVVAAVTTANFVKIRIEGSAIEALAMRPVKGTIKATVVDGNAPRRAGEIALGGATLGDLGVELGDTVAANGRDGAVRFRVVGQVAFPSVDDSVPLAAGALLTPAGLRRVDDLRNLQGYHRNLVRFAPGVDVAAERRRLQRLGNEEAGTCTGCKLSAFAPRLPAEIERLRQLETLPLVLAGFLGLLGVVALGHGLASAVRRRRRDLALLKTLGFSRRQVSATIAWQATTVAVVGAAVGIPIGVVLGRWFWALIADGLGVAATPDVEPLAIVGVGLAAVLVGNVVAFVPGRIAARTKPAVVLRSE
jgi:FtsX-like permease family